MPTLDTNNQSDDEDDFYTRPTEDTEYKDYLRQPVSNKKVYYILFIIVNKVLYKLLTINIDKPARVLETTRFKISSTKPYG